MFCVLSFPAFSGIVEVKSPDGKQKAVIYSYENDESVISVVNSADKDSKVLASINLLSEDHQHGYVIYKYKWSDDSKFFVFNTESSGGHSPWHYISLFFSRASETFRNIDIRANISVTSEKFTLGKNGKFTSMAFANGQSIDNAMMTTINLKSIDKPLKY